MRRFERDPSIRDQGKSVAEARLVQSIIENLPPYYPHPHDVEDTRTGFDSEGNYHHPSLRTEHVDRPTIERPVQLDGRWDVT